MTDSKDQLRRLFAGETITIGGPPMSPDASERMRAALEEAVEQSQRFWRDARADTEYAGLVIHHVRGEDIAAIRAQLATIDDDDDPGAETWAAAVTELAAHAIARDATTLLGQTVVANSLLDLFGRSHDSMYAPDEVRALVSTIAQRPDLFQAVAAGVAAWRMREDDPPWSAASLEAPYKWVTSSLRRAAIAGLGILAR